MMDEQQAIALLKQGDLGGLEVLVRLYQLRAIRAACLILGERTQAEDIVQSSFLRAAEKIHQFDDRRAFGPWFFRGVINAAIKSAKRQKRQIPLENDEENEPFNLADPVPLPSDLVETEETRQAVWHALQRLAPKQRAVVILHYYLGLTEEEIEPILKSPIGTVKWRLYAARKRLKKFLSLDAAATDEKSEEI